MKLRIGVLALWQSVSGDMKFEMKIRGKTHADYVEREMVVKLKDNNNSVWWFLLTLLDKF